jgi:hypothetical protein
MTSEYEKIKYFWEKKENDICIEFIKTRFETVEDFVRLRDKIRKCRDEHLLPKKGTRLYVEWQAFRSKPYNHTDFLKAKVSMPPDECLQDYYDFSKL